MINLDHCILLGTLSKTHGVKGNLLLRLKHLGFENIIKMESVFIIIDNLPVPFFVSEYTHHHSDELMLHFDDIDSQDKAKKYVGFEVWLDVKSVQKSKSSDSPSSMSRMIGYEVVDKQLGSLGKLNEVIEVKQNPLLQILNSSGEILIPLQSEFVIEIDDKKKLIHVDTPEGLVDVNQGADPLL